jgi:hypothetical protein
MVKKGFFRAWPRPVLVAGGAAMLLTAAFTAAWIGHPRLLAGVRGFKPARDFPLRDSLPALSEGLRDLEAFKFTIDGRAWTDPGRSVWLTDSGGDFEMEYWTDKRRFDSVDFYAWTDDSLMTVERRRGTRMTAWRIPYRRKIGSWVEAVGAYASRPRTFEIRPRDSSIAFFERVEGSRIHLVRYTYPRRRETAIPADTTYAASVSGNLEILAKDEHLAIVNPSPRPVRLKVGRFRARSWAVCEIGPRQTGIYRNFLKAGSGPFLAYTNPGTPHFSLFGKTGVETAYFVLARE